ncbi:D-TA family PLP-dependent enzyme [Engelhardtia mirabilis]|uniref:D-threonine aldolase n=1 Tax=Engelhardtia mirabilis TaxID=2528011 RepID=A0A518BQ92_9BACT|nr:D-threonine aldolase [Planctomycetes bacterium Pla133]QDV03473.1 D-threonine aldolase [Planctomycetes bacterium Pla86]
MDTNSGLTRGGRASSPFNSAAPLSRGLAPDLLDRLLTPALLVDLRAAARNVDRVIAWAGADADRWRPHLKTTKTPQIWALLLARGLRAFKVATTAELRVLLELLDGLPAGDFGDVLVAYPQSSASARRTSQLAALHPRHTVSVLVEEPAAVGLVRPNVGLFVDANPGMDRTGAPYDDVDRILATARAAGPRLRGLHAYEGHLHADFPERGVRIDACFARLRGILRQLHGAGVVVAEVVTSGTPAFRHVLETRPLEGAAGEPLHRVSPGTVVLHDLRSELENPELGLEPAAVVLSRIVSRPRSGRVTCDAGSKALAAEAGSPVAVALGIRGLEAATPNEEHLPLDGPEGALPALGGLLDLVPMHVCPTVNLHDRVLLLDDDGVRDVPVAARGHELFVDD